MDAKIVPEIDLESNIKKLHFRCPICIEDFGEEKLTYNNQCTSGKHYLCNDCNEKYIKNCNKSRKDHICVICKEVIKVYEEVEEIVPIDDINMHIRAIHIQNSVNQNNESIPFIVKLLIFDFVFIVITLIIMGSINVSRSTKNSIYAMYGFLLFTTLTVCCISQQSNVRILP
jgi:hypothetical protein